MNQNVGTTINGFVDERILTVKPTGLPVLRMPFFLPDLYLHADEHAQKPSAQAIGVNADASFRLACHKAQTTDTLKNKGTAAATCRPKSSTLLPATGALEL